MFSAAGTQYVLALRGGDRVEAVDGAELVEQRAGAVTLRIAIPAEADWQRRTVRLTIGG